MRKLTKWTGILCAALLTAALSFASFAENGGQSQAASQSPAFEGTIVSVEDGRLTMNRRLGEGTEDMIVNITDTTKILDAINGYPVNLDSLKEGDAVRVYAGETMTMSIPPIVNGVVILTGVPEDAAFPSYTKVESMKQNPVSADGTTGGDYVLTTTDGNTYTINSSSTLLPYLTRNIVTEADLTEGREILVWGNNGFAEKIVIFPESVDSETAEKSGWQLEDGSWYFYEQGAKKTGWLLDGGDWYYLNPETGRMQTGFVVLDGKAYYLKEDGRMLKEAHIFTPDENGALQINFE